MRPPTPSAERLDTFRLDVKGTQVASALTAAGVETLLLKGAAFDQLLFEGARSRAYADIDLLVAPDRALAAGRVLEQLGFHLAKRQRAGLARVARLGRFAFGAHAAAWVRAQDGFTIDLHTTLPQVRASASQVWQTLGAHHETIEVVGAATKTLDRSASALLIALHAAHHGPNWRRAQTDLRRACAVLEPECWRAAARLAHELRAEGAMGVGLGTSEEGVLLARQLGLRTRPTLAHRLKWAGAGWLGRWRARRRVR